MWYTYPCGSSSYPSAKNKGNVIMKCNMNTDKDWDMDMPYTPIYYAAIIACLYPSVLHIYLIYCIICSSQGVELTLTAKNGRAQI